MGFGEYATSKIGGTRTGTVAVASARINIMSTTGGDSVKLVPGALWVALCTVDTHLRQGGSTVTATTSDFLLRANTYWPLKLDNENDAWLAYIRDGATDGTIYITRVDDIAAVTN